MWPFSRKISNSELHEAFRQLKADFTALEFEWQQVRHSLKKLTGRLAKSAALEEAKDATNPPEAATSPSLENGGLFGLTDNQRVIQQRILQSRQKKFG